MFFYVVEGIFEIILDLIPPKIRKVIGIILIIISSILTLLIAILFQEPSQTEGGLGALVIVMMVILSFLIGFKMTFYETEEDYTRWNND